jgi:hypothetical protein
MSGKLSRIYGEIAQWMKRAAIRFCGSAFFCLKIGVVPCTRPDPPTQDEAGLCARGGYSWKCFKSCTTDCCVYICTLCIETLPLLYICGTDQSPAFETVTVQINLVRVADFSRVYAPYLWVYLCRLLQRVKALPPSRRETCVGDELKSVKLRVNADFPVDCYVCAV